jgi:phage gp36-like protein
MYSDLNTYANVAAVEARLTEYSVTWAADRDLCDGERAAKELAWIEAAVEWANNLIDAAIQKHVQTIAARPRNAWLADRCVDVAAYRVMTIGGIDAPRVLQEDYERAIAWLAGVENGSVTVPGLNDAVVLSGGRQQSGPRYFGNQWRPGS